MLNIFTAQLEEISKHKYYESKKVGHDVGEKWAAGDWVTKYATDFRKHWEKEMLLKRIRNVEKEIHAVMQDIKQLN